MYDYLIIGCGMFGSVCARELTNHGYKCLIIDKRNHIAGNCYSSNYNGIDVHEYGPHIFHTNNEEIWNYINQFSKFNNYYHRPKVRYQEKIYSFPINLLTLYQLFGIKSPQEAINKIESMRKKIDDPKNLEEWILSKVGYDIYRTFFYGYTKKQWNKNPKDLPIDIVKRIPIRLTYEDNYFFDKYQGIPTYGYTELFKNMLDGIDIELNVNYLEKRDYWNNRAKRIIYSGPIDEFFNMEHGALEWRSLDFKKEIYNIEDYQGCAIVNYTDENIPFTRIVEHKHFNFAQSKETVITKEFPSNYEIGKEKYYPINDIKNNEIYEKYRKLIDKNKFIFGGRLAEYIYYDMHQVIGSALKTVKQELN